jgi:threonylcarbamoyladenosine tRNA methylthiotransferase MtaB
VKYSILTFGCRVNQADSFDRERVLRACGGEEEPPERADLVVVNTCSVTAAAEQAARQAIRRIARLNPAARIVATGCYAMRHPAEVASLPVSSVVAAHGGVDAAADLLPLLQPSGRRAAGARRLPMPGPGTLGRTLYLLRVQSGCNEDCAYCIVPTTRGRSRSVPIAEVLSEVCAAAAAGFREVVLTGVHLGAYGRDLRPSGSLGQLVRALAEHPAPVRFRLSAVEPMDAGDVVIETLAGSGRFARQFHLPLQHASDRMLRVMRRPYDLAAYRRVVDRLRLRFPDASIGSDFIVGFPGETEEDFEACAAYLAASPLTYAHVFPFSPRPGTSAAAMPGRPRAADVGRRVGCLRELAREKGRRFRAGFIGRVLEGITIGDGSLVLTDNYLKVRVPGGLTRNLRVSVRVLAEGEPMTGEVPNMEP